MDWIDRMQVELGAPVLGFVQQFWIPLLVLGMLGVWYLWFYEPGQNRDDDEGIELTELGDGDGGGDGGD